MHKVYELKEMLCDELEAYGDKDKLDMGSLEIVDKLAHAIKNLDKIIESYEEEEYSSRMSYDGGSYENDGMSYARNRGGRYSRERGSYARGGNGRGRGSNARRDSMGRYSSHGDIAGELRELMQEAPDNARQEFQRLINMVEGM